MKTKSIKILVLLLTLISIIVGSSFTLAKYTGIFTNEHVIKSNNFYFKSDFMNNNSILNLYGGISHDINIDINNFLDDLHISTDNINYSVLTSVNNDFSNYSINIEGVLATNGTLLGSIKTTNELKITIGEGYEDLTKITLTVASTSPYIKTISMQLILHQEEGIKYEIIDSVNSLKAELIITTTRNINANTLVVNWSNATDLLVDTTDIDYINKVSSKENISGWCYEISFNSIGENSSISLYFFKTNPTIDYSATIQNVVLNTIVIGE